LSLKSMTGFASCADALDGFSWRWEIRSVNGRGLDVRMRLGKRDGLEKTVREKIAKLFQRGSIQVSLTIEQETHESHIQINEKVLDQVIEVARETSEKIGGGAISADGLLSLPGVMSEVRGMESEDEAAQRQTALLASLDGLLLEMSEMRAAEGAQIETVLREQVDQITRLSKQARDNPSRSPEAIAKRLSEQTDVLLNGSSSELSQDRLYAEAALIAVKADIKEELDRIDAHASSVVALFDEDVPVGRKLEFLVQELAREANTLCAKSGDPSLTQTGLTLKTCIDQMREQILNLE
jgi:uncharacterized protein (TIGR00255 family)